MESNTRYYPCINIHTGKTMECTESVTKSANFIKKGWRVNLPEPLPIEEQIAKDLGIDDNQGKTINDHEPFDAELGMTEIPEEKLVMETTIIDTYDVKAIKEEIIQGLKEIPEDDAKVITIKDVPISDEMKARIIQKPAPKPKTTRKAKPKKSKK